MGNKMVCMPIKEFKGTFRYRSRKEMKRSSSMKKLMSEKDKISHLSQRYESCVINRVVPTRSQPPRSLSDPLPNHKQVPIFVEKIETKKVILVHGEGLGAWCWYKIVPMMEEAGMVPVALDLAGSGTNNSIDFSRITSLEDYSKPLMNYLGSLADNEKVILVGHSCGGATISLAMEKYPNKISKAIFLCATMVNNGQRPFDPFAQELGPAELFLKESQNLLYGNGKEKPPTALLLEKDQIKCLYFNHCSPKDVALASMSMRAVPLVPMMEKMKLTAENYGNVRRFFIHTSDDNILRLQIQEEMVQKNPPHGVYKIKGSDHSPFFSKPRSLNKILLEIAQL
ncbi:putative methylesterase 14, chloroplastic isoform X1 [Phalaenopsis equestris]|uniref:putative methylesterase 14, chloroplastic isoform X1 n=1 Tax=Phalaenopsis equestris TaxID=78828 RepID=UPI0009E26D88|nr:putative methylesterase 14, chloroplastic isoform X1 [Phalaenopsis equestris]